MKIESINWASPEGVQILAEMTEMLLYGGECQIMRDDSGKLIAVYAVGILEDNGQVLSGFYRSSEQ